MKSHRALGIPVLLRPSTVINIPQKKIKREYETWSKTNQLGLLQALQDINVNKSINNMEKKEHNDSRIHLLKAWLSILEIKNHKSKSSSKCSP
jgi:hypothetical protein